ncbi:MAG: immune inhibitor A [Clostridia bacterium]|nr:immune inhibitor A [Clostridia bacterium]
MKKTLFLTFCAAVLTAALFALAPRAGAVCARPGSGYSGEAAACRSAVFPLVTPGDIPSAAPGSGRSKAPAHGSAPKTIPLLTVVVGFGNIDYKKDFDWNARIFDGDESLAAYYSDMSFGQFTFTPASESSVYGVDGNSNTRDAADDGVVHVRLGTDHDDWIGLEDYSDGEASMVAALIAAINAADPCVDFAAYDADGDGAIENNELALCFVLAGYEASATSSYTKGRQFYFWAHAWEIDSFDPEQVPTPDSVSVSAYIGIAEQVEPGVQEPISVLAHELGHYLGLPDLYDVYSTAGAPWSDYSCAYLSLMDSGMWGVDEEGYNRPYSLDAWSRAVLGWYEPTEADRDGEYAVCDESSGGFSAVRIPTANGNEYFLVENRAFAGWDSGMGLDYPGAEENGGLIIWHVDDAVYGEYAETNEVNVGTHRPAVMPLYPEKTDGGEPCFTGSEVDLTAPFFSKTVWESGFAPTLGESLDLPVYGAGKEADWPSARKLSGIKLSFSGGGSPEMTVGVEFPAKAPDMSETEYDMVCDVNSYRCSLGTDPLTVEPSLLGAARLRAGELAELFSHDRPDGSSWRTALPGGAYEYELAGENIAMYQTSHGEVFESWHASEGHRLNMENAGFTHIGVGFDAGGLGWVQDFVGDADCGYSKLELCGGPDPVQAGFGEDFDSLRLVLACDCAVHGRTYLPLTKEFVTGYDPVRSGGQTVTARVFGLSVSFEVTVAECAHEETYVEGAKDPNCTEDGYSGDVYCLLCSALLEKGKNLPAAGHSPEAVLGTDPTCTEPGLTDGVKCSVCGEILTGQEEIPSAGHVKETVPGTDPTCTEPGLTDGVKCAVCGEILTEQEEIPSAGHVKETVPGTDPTCTEPGLTDGVKCAVCGEILTEQEEIPSAGHVKETVPGTDPTCTEPGLTDGVKCAVCGEILTEQEEIPASGHSFSEWELTAAPTPGSPGVEERVCAVCGEKETRPVAFDPAETVVPGDVDGDGLVTAADARLALRAAVGLEHPDELGALAADVDGDEKITPADARAILRKVVGLEELPDKTGRRQQAVGYRE